MPHEFDLMVLKIGIGMVDIIDIQPRTRPPSLNRDEILLLLSGLTDPDLHNLRILMQGVLHTHILLPHGPHIPDTPGGMLGFGLRVFAVTHIRLVGGDIHVKLVDSVVGDRVGPDEQVHAAPGVLYVGL